MKSARQLHTSTLLPNGKVLVVGGYKSDYPNSYVYRSAEIYSPTRRAWSYTGNMENYRYLHTATLLSNGKVLVAGGLCNGNYIRTAEIYDPATGTWRSVASMNTPRQSHQATLLPNGKVIVTGGLSSSSTCTSSAELYDPISDSWSYTGEMVYGACGHTAALLANGNVLVVRAYSEIYDYKLGKWSTAGTLKQEHWGGHTETVMKNGKVLVTGGVGNLLTSAINTVELYNPSTGTWGYRKVMNMARSKHTATLLLNGSVLVAGGWSGGVRLRTAELYTY
jgi:N-acetylneuraminic acid mutarotase